MLCVQKVHIMNIRGLKMLILSAIVLNLLFLFLLIMFCALIGYPNPDKEDNSLSILSLIFGTTTILCVFFPVLMCLINSISSTVLILGIFADLTPRS
jgi:hypothetical protein